MGVSLTDISQQLKDNNKKVQLIYAFNVNGKKILYYNAFTEDLFYWDNYQFK